MTEPTLLVTHTVPPETTEGLLAALRDELPNAEILTAATPEETEALLDRADALVTGRLDAKTVENGEFEWVQALSAGVDNYPHDALAEAGVTLTNASGVHAEPIGEQVLGAMLSFERRFIESQRNKERNSWERVEGGELNGKTLGIVGVGAIGSRVAELGSAFGMAVLGTKRDPETMPEAVDEAFGADGYTELCRRADYLVLACPLTDETEGLIGAPEFRLLDSEAVLVNIARGAVCDEEALTRALQYKQIRGAALDVFETEPLPADSPLWDLSNVLLTPHMAGSTTKKDERWADIIGENYRRFDTNEAYVNRVK
ncbi:Phosphoglycerate dehydrogenase [halophilic archaeon DL31]|jgi:phosphoglycerate dehydrogenase-like enzyme|nr:Phosphoglycerate dehydrogenase [halophilic archaeon DL31]